MLSAMTPRERRKHKRELLFWRLVKAVLFLGCGYLISKGIAYCFDVSIWHAFILVLSIDYALRLVTKDKDTL